MDSVKNIKNQYLHISIPASLEAVLLILLSSIDIIMLGQLGKNELASVAVFTQPRLILLCFPKALSITVMATISQFIGLNKERKIKAFLKQALVFNLFISIILCSTAFIFMEDILIFSGKSNYTTDSLVYGKINMLGIFFNFFSIIIGGSLTGLGNTKKVLIGGLIGNITNIILNYLLIFGIGFFPRLEVKGAAIGTVIGSFITFIYLAMELINKNSYLFILSKRNWLPKKLFYRTMPLTIASFLELFFERIGMFLYTLMVAQLGVVAFAAHTISMNACDIFYSLGQGFSKGSLVLSSRALGEHNKDKLKIIKSLSTKTSIVLGSIATLIYFIFRGNISAIYSHDIDVLAITNYTLMIVALVSIPEMINLTHSGILRGLGKMSYVAKYSFISIAIARPIITYILCFKLNLGVYGACIALFIDQSTRATFAYIGSKITIKSF